MEMLTNISIKNFRCFSESSFKGFNRVNLIGGKNNAGKTALLEALLINFLPANGSVRLLQKFRQEDDKTAKKYPERTWENLFFNQQKNQNIVLNSTYSNDYNSIIELRCDESIEDFIKYVDEKENDSENMEFAQLKNSVSNSTNSALHIDATKNGEKYASSVLVASSKGIVGKSGSAPDPSVVDFVHSRMSFTQQSLASDFDNAFDKGYYEFIIDGLKIIDDSILEARTSSIGSPVIKINRDGEKSMPLSYFGDAIYKIMSVVLKLLNGRENGVLLIDEIENGMHYTSHNNYWNLLFRLAEKFKIQIFATSHSLEMIRSFNEVANSPEFRYSATYFEMARHIKTNEIIVNPMDMEMLDYELKSNNSFRGE
jgi:AAA15 family ATPase/GTPase